MRCITLTQPWATLVALGMKKIETRSWATSYRGKLAIHAAQGLGPVGGSRGLEALCRSEPFASALGFEPDPFKAALLANLAPFQHTPALLPRGAIVAVCDLIGVVPVASLHQHTLIDWPLTDRERAFGDYSAGRFAWMLADVRALPEPIPARGALGLWNWDGAIDL
jgi:hypothetical protein